MKQSPNNAAPNQMLVAVLTALLAVAGCKPAAPPPAPKPAAAPPKLATAPLGGDTSASHVSIFEDLLPPQGRDPFFSGFPPPRSGAAAGGHGGA